MAIPLTRYVFITSGIGAGNNLRQRDLITRIFSQNPLVPTNGVLEFTSAADVANFFGSTSLEYLRAAFYFGWISKSISTPTKISFARWANVAVAPTIYGVRGAQSVASYTSITAGAFTLSMGGSAQSITGINFSSASSLSDVASILQTAIRAKTGTAFTAATVTYDPVRQSFNFVGGATGASVITVVAGTGGNDVAGQIGWLPGTTALFSDGSDIQTLTQLLNTSINISNNFGSFCFTVYLTPAQNLEVATVNDSSAYNNQFMFLVPTTAADASTNSTNLLGLAGEALTLAPISTEYPEMVPGMILAATDYTKRNSVKNYMFQQFTLTPSVSDSTNANLYDGLRVNYYGETQSAGQKVQFYQRGIMTGLASDPVDMNVYANEMWLKDSASANIMTLLLSLEKISANNNGRIQLQTALQGTINAALNNGTISVGKTLTPAQQLYITQITGDDQAWRQVQAIGYWLDVTFQQYVGLGGTTEYRAVYTLVYSKDDDIRSVNGTHILI